MVSGRDHRHPPATALQTDQERWLAARRRLNLHRGELTRMAAALYPDVPRVSSVPLLTRPDWVPERPIPLDAVSLRWRDIEQIERADGEPSRYAGASQGVCALRTDSTRFASYAETMQVLSKPRVFADLPSYRLLAAHPAADTMSLEFTTGRYFDAINVGEACAHELAMATMDSAGAVPDRDSLALRTQVGDPTHLARRPALLGVSVLTVRLDDHTGKATFLMHLRDAGKVATGGGQCHVVPVGLFQPPPGRPSAPDSCFDIWRLMVREFAEELLGHPDESPLDERAAAFHAALDAARATGRCRPYYLGLGVDPLMLATDILTVVLFDGSTFDELFGGLTGVNGEGALVRHGSDVWFPFNESQVRRMSNSAQTQPAGAATLILTWKGREALAIGC
jgi:hypothetical protein